MRRLLFLLVLAAVSTAMFPLTAWAGRVEVTPFAGHTWGGEFVETTTTTTFSVRETSNIGIMVNFEQDERSTIELYLSHQATQLRASQGTFVSTPVFDLDIEYFHVGGTYGEAEGLVRPYVAGGFGLTRMVPKLDGLDSVMRFSMNLGVGVKLQMTERVGVRIEGRGFGTLFNGSGAVFCSSGACAFQVQGNLFTQFVMNAGLSVAF